MKSIAYNGLLTCQCKGNQILLNAGRQDNEICYFAFRSWAPVWGLKSNIQTLNYQYNQAKAFLFNQ